MPKPKPKSRHSSPARSVAPGEVARFEAQAPAWWDETGPFAPLHRLNPVRLAYIRDQAAARFGRPGNRFRPLAGLSILDVGCGGGLLCEPLARLGGRVTGIDAGAENIREAVRHARAQNLAIDYRAQTVEALARGKRRFDIVLNMEVIEHAADPAVLIAASAALVRPGGMLMLSTLNRTLKSLLLAKVAAEYVLGWVPAGTHDWRKFVPPADLAGMAAKAGLVPGAATGMVYDPWRDDWRTGPDTGVNYLMTATKRGSRRRQSKSLHRGEIHP
ncbi:MAG: bifunctional 2-polyprenyl-6-hydroxyphenol methylase/3-demethylubiquinol 3-O-methyltransferase UbiG [Alphaproteobacteria bacterium]|nr:bifunctional 2-polyprenyl-6-hydroxyphenol methylase/3-demethylubiquinol 3-O-methyltransferase UbiG [Alphaproteobacteria bacterium]